MVLFSFNDVWWRPSKVWSMLFGFPVWGEKGAVKNWVDLPRLGEEKLRVDWGSGKDFERPEALAVSLAFGCVVLTFVPSNHTSCPSLKATKGEWGPFHVIISAATFRVAETSVWRQFSVLSHSSTDGRWEAKLTGGRNSGWKPYQIWNGECLVALWARMLWANSAKGSKSA